MSVNCKSGVFVNYLDALDEGPFVNRDGEKLDRVFLELQVLDQLGHLILKGGWKNWMGSPSYSLLLEQLLQLLGLPYKAELILLSLGFRLLKGVLQVQLVLKAQPLQLLDDRLVLGVLLVERVLYLDEVQLSQHVQVELPEVPHEGLSLVMVDDV